jgi:hypothetical protein
LFVDLVRHGYRRADDADVDDVRPELAAHAWQVLDGLRRLPGSDEHGHVNADALRTWVKRARELLAEADRVDVGDQTLGQFLANSPPGQDGVWPAEPVRDVIEASQSDELEEGLAIGRYNSRGTTVRDPYEGGASERELALRLRVDAARLDVRWSRTSRVLRRLADDYDADAERYDRDAERRSDEG